MWENLAYACGIGGALLGIGWRYLRRIDLGVGNALREVAEEIARSRAENAQKTQVPGDFDDGRIAALERRMEMLEKDARTWLARANTRLRRARELAGDEEEDGDDEATPEQIAEGLRAVQSAPRPDQTELSLSQIRSIGLGGRFTNGS